MLTWWLTVACLGKRNVGMMLQDGSKHNPVQTHVKGSFKLHLSDLGDSCEKHELIMPLLGFKVFSPAPEVFFNLPFFFD